MAEKRIVVVDDSEIVLAMTASALESGGYEVRTLQHWEELDPTLKEFKPDLILMDINMPEMFGDFVMMYFKEERGIGSIPILLYSDIEVEDLVQRARESGADGYISKRWGVERMVEIVNGYLRPPSK